MAVAFPIGYLVWQAFVAPDTVAPVLTAANMKLLGNTLLLAGSVLCCVTFVGGLLAWLTVRTNLVGRRIFAILAVLPLAIPGYVMAYAFMGMGGYKGMLDQLLSVSIKTPSGFWYALLALAAYNLPYMYLTLRAAMRDMDPSLEEAARSLGHSRLHVLFSVVMPQLKPAYFAGGLLVVLHVIADFGVVSLMRFDTFSRVLWLRYESAGLDAPNSAAPVALVLVAVAGFFIVLEMVFLRRLRLDRAGIGAGRPHAIKRLRYWQLPAMLFCLIVFAVSVVLPTSSVVFWMLKGDVAASWSKILGPLISSVGASLPAAVAATALALPIAHLRARYATRSSFILERLPFIGYAVPALAFALSLIMLFGAKWTPDWMFSLYQSLPLLVFAYAIHFLAEAVAPVRSSMYMTGPRMEEASRSLGRGPWTTFWKVTLPVLRNGLIVSMVLVFLSCMKELPLTMLLSPPGFETLAFNVWDASDDARFGDAAPFALTILIFSACFVCVLLLQGRKENK
jgi:iron(III) transport system permease protein